MKIKCPNCNKEHSFSGRDIACSCGRVISIISRSPDKTTARLLKEIKEIEREIKEGITDKVGERETRNGKSISEVLRKEGTYQLGSQTLKSGEIRYYAMYAYYEGGKNSSVSLGTLGIGEMPSRDEYMHLLNLQSKLILLKRQLEGKGSGKKWQENIRKSGRLFRKEALPRRASKK